MLALQAPEGAAFDFLVLFAIVLAGPAIMAKAKIPGIIGLLVGGWLIGPHGLGLIGSGNQTIPELGQLGLLYLMFVAGLELDLGMLRLHRSTALGFALLTFAAPFLGGVLVGVALDFSPAAGLLLGSVVASHTLILYPVVRQAGLGSNRAVASAVGATVLTDTLALVVLAGVAGSETGSGSSASTFIELGIGLVTLVVVSLIGLPLLSRIVFRHVGSDRSTRFLTALLAFLLMASLSEVFGIEGIVGAFFAGLAMNPLVPNEGQSMHRLEFFGSTVFIPIFLVSTGLLLDPAVMVQGETLGYATLFVLACLGGKALAAGATIPLFKVNRPEAGLMFVLTTPQAAATLAATVVGFEIGLFSTVVVNAVLVLILVSIVVSSLLAPRLIRQVDVVAEDERQIGERILLAVGVGSPSRMLLQFTGRVAQRSGGVVDEVLVRTTGPEPIDRTALEALEAIAEREGFDGEGHVAVDRHGPGAIVNAAASHDASLVLVDASVGLDGESAPWTEAMAMSIPTPMVLFQGGGPAIDRVVLVAPTADQAAAEGAPAVGFLRELATAVAGKSPVEISMDGPWVEQLGPGDLAFVLVDAWDVVAGLPKPPEGAAVAAVPAPTVLGRPTPSVPTTDPVEPTEA
jgi:Kef-type K+ transport system membrane component KefB